MRTRRIAVAALATLALVALAVGVPAMLLAGLGNPLISWSTLTSGDLDDTTVLHLLACVVWLAWLQWIPGTVLEVAAAVRGVRLPRHISAGQGLSRVLITAVIGAAIAAPLVSNTARVWAAPAPASNSSPVVSSQLASAPTRASGNADVGLSAAPTSARNAHHGGQRHSGPTFEVGSDPTVGASLWSIAQHTMGNPLRWREIWDLNRDTAQPGGAVFNNPDDIQNGWQLRLPADATVPATSRHDSGSGTTTVHSGDTLTKIADRDHVTEPNLYAANKGRNEPGDRHLTDPDLILPGWTLTMPSNAVTPVHSTPTHTTPSTPGSSTTTPSKSTTPSRPSQPEPGQSLPADPGSGSTAQSTHEPATPTAPTPASTPVTAPHREPAHAEQAPTSRPAAHSTSDLPMVAFAGGGVLLAGISLTALTGYRRRQFRQRRPGHTITPCSPELLPVERTLRSVGGPAVVDVTWLDHTLRGLAHNIGDREDAASRLPDVMAVRMGHERLELILASAQPNAPESWEVDETGTRWSIARDEQSDYDPTQRAYHFAPFPTLSSVGYAEDGSQWLLDLERVASMSLAGDPERCLNLARFLACELAHNTWSEMLQVTLVGFGRELAEINPDRLTYTDDLDAAIAELAEHVHTVEQSLARTGVGVVEARSASTGDVWAPHVLLIAPDAARNTQGLDRLLTAASAQPARMAVALVLSNDADHADATAWTLTIDEDGTLHVPALGLTLRAQQLPADEAAELAQRLAQAAHPDDQPMPRPLGTEPWDSYCDAAGALLLPELNATSSDDPADGETSSGTNRAPEQPTAANPAPVRLGGAVDNPALHLADSPPSMYTSVLPLSREAYLEQTATTADDLDALAPETNDEIREQVETTVGELDADLAEWHSQTTVRPRVSVLGPVTVRAQGPLPARNPRTQWHTEIVAYLATRPSGVSSEQYATDLWPNDPDPDLASKSKVRQSVMIVRKWLGKNPATDTEYIPPAMAPGYASYRVEGALLDAELFRRLRLRGLARGTDGIDDLWSALRLVTGEPFSQRRPEGYAWLAENPLDHIYAAMIVDVAHTVATHHLAAGEAQHAAAAAQVALNAGSKEDVPLLDQVFACDAQDKRLEANEFIQRLYANHDAEIEEDLPPRTAEVLRRRQWLDAG